MELDINFSEIVHTYDIYTAPHILVYDIKESSNVVSGDIVTTSIPHKSGIVVYAGIGIGVSDIDLYSSNDAVLPPAKIGISSNVRVVSKAVKTGMAASVGMSASAHISRRNDIGQMSNTSGIDVSCTIIPDLQISASSSIGIDNSPISLTNTTTTSISASIGVGQDVRRYRVYNNIYATNNIGINSIAGIYDRGGLDVENGIAIGNELPNIMVISNIHDVQSNIGIKNEVLSVELVKAISASDTIKVGVSLNSDPEMAKRLLSLSNSLAIGNEINVLHSEKITGSLNSKMAINTSLSTALKRYRTLSDLDYTTLGWMDSNTLDYLTYVNI